MQKILKYFLVMISINVNAQNLVPNPSFEDAISCFHSIDSCQSWHNPSAYSPDYLNSCISGAYSVPLNDYGYQTANTGNAYAGIILEYRGTVGSSREYIQAELTDSLLNGRKYSVSFLVSISDSTSFAVNDIGAFFSEAAISSTVVTYFPVQPQVNNNHLSNPLNQRDIWIPVVDTFIATGGEKFITIGNFKDDANTDTTSISGGSSFLNYSYYYIDDVSVIMVDSVNSIDDLYSDKGMAVILFDNYSNKIKISSSEIIRNMRIYDHAGRLVSNQNINSKIYENIFDSKGLFLIQLEYKNYSYCRKLLIN